MVALKKTPKIGIIGCGGNGTAHARVISQHVPELALCAYADLNPARAQDCLRQFGGNYATSEPERLIADPQIDAVIVSTWYDTHPSFTIAAAQAKKHVLVEKPMATTIADCRSMAQTAQQNAVKLMVGYNFPHSPLVTEAKRFIGPADFTLARAILHRRFAPGNWHLDPVKGSGALLFDCGSHLVSLLCRLHEALPTRVFAEGGAFNRRADLESVVATIHFNNGSIASLAVLEGGAQSETATALPQDKWFLETSGSKSLAAIEFVSAIAHFGGEASRQPFTIPTEDSRGFISEHRAFARWLIHDEPPLYGSPQDGIICTQTLVAINDAVTTAHPQSI